jgi:tetraacyldisaccharide 4'-kinase
MNLRDAIRLTAQGKPSPSPIYNSSLFEYSLELASKVYGLGSRFDRYYRLKWKEPQRLQAPVISVGNITWGGTGKTPLTEWIAHYYHTKHVQSIVLTRVRF